MAKIIATIIECTRETWKAKVIVSKILNENKVIVLEHHRYLTDGRVDVKFFELTPEEAREVGEALIERSKDI